MFTDNFHKANTMANDPFTAEHGTPTCDAACSRMGWIEYIAMAFPDVELHVSVSPEANLDATVTAFSHDEQKEITLKGCMFTFERVA